jgi:hypothetical protein
MDGEGGGGGAQADTEMECISIWCSPSCTRVCIVKSAPEAPYCWRQHHAYVALGCAR